MDIERPMSDVKLNSEDEETNVNLENKSSSSLGPFYKPVLVVTCPENSVTFKEEFAVSDYVTSNITSNFTYNLCRGYKIKICKPLIPLKMVLFCWFGATSFFTPFITVYFKQRGITLTELSTAYIVSPVAQFSGTLLAGIIADKIGRAKPVLVLNLVLTIVTIICILSVPIPDTVNCNIKSTNLECLSNSTMSFTGTPNCDVIEVTADNSSCDSQCLKNLTEHCKSRDFKLYNKSGESDLFLLNINENSSNVEKECLFLNATFCNCAFSNETYCSIFCSTKSRNMCFNESQKSIFNKVIMGLYILLMVVYSNCYRFLDITAVYMVEEHNSDFGRERFFSIAGNLVVSPLAGYLVSATTPDGGEKNYSAAFYLFIALILFILLIVYKLDVQIKAPGKKMLKKSVILLKNCDVLSFVIVVFVLGTAWGYMTKYLFWYLEELKTPSILIGLIPAAGALYGLPFLLTSNWWMTKIGTSWMLVIGLLGYVLYATSYSFITDPWLSLILEAANVVTYHLLWVAVICRCHELAPVGLSATVISVAGSLHYHIGKSSGSAIGFFVTNNYNGKIAFRVIAVLCLVCALFYSLFLYCRQKRFGLTRVPQQDESVEDGKSKA